MTNPIELPNSPQPAPPMTVPVLRSAVLTGCTIGLVLLLIDAVVPGRVYPVVLVVDPPAFVLIGGLSVPLFQAISIAAISVLMNGAFYGMLGLIALIAMTFAGVRSTFQRRHWVTLGTLMTFMMIAVRFAAFH
jgi:hypothetical protein